MRENEVEKGRETHRGQQASVALATPIPVVPGHSHALFLPSQVTVCRRKKEGNYEVQQHSLDSYLPHLDLRKLQWELCVRLQRSLARAGINHIGRTQSLGPSWLGPWLVHRGPRWKVFPSTESWRATASLCFGFMPFRPSEAPELARDPDIVNHVKSTSHLSARFLFLETLEHASPWLCASHHTHLRSSIFPHPQSSPNTVSFSEAQVHQDFQTSLPQWLLSPHGSSKMGNNPRRNEWVRNDSAINVGTWSWNH